MVWAFSIQRTLRTFSGVTTDLILGYIVQPVAKKLAKATGAENYNILQNNGRLAHQVVDHVSPLVSISAG